MIKRTRLCVFCIVSILPAIIFAQTNTYILNGTATQNKCNCYTLTTTSPMFQSGSVWNANKINLNTAFDFVFNVNLGCSDAGADGIVFILQPISTSIGSSGEGMGFEGVSPSIGIALDTYQNFNRNDPSYDHISIQKNGQINHVADLAGPVAISATSDNVEDCQWHTLRIAWNPATQLLQVFFDATKRVETNVNLIGSIFNGDPMVYWGFTGATGGAVNVQQFCTALNPDFKTNLPQDGTCAGSTIQLADSSESFAPIAAYYWNFGDGTTSNQAVPPPHAYSQPGQYPIKMAITAFDGCRSDTTTRLITIGAAPDAAFSINDTCQGQTPVVKTSGKNVGSTYGWQLDGNNFSANQQPVLPLLTAGTYSLQQTVTSNYGCGATSVVAQSFRIKPVPHIAFDARDGCVQQLISFNGRQTDPATIISKWHWQFGDGSMASIQNPIHSFTQKGNYKLALFAIADNGCTSDTVVKNIFINRAIADAGHDTIVLKNIPFYLNGSGNGTLVWSPSTALNNPFINRPMASLNDDMDYALTSTTAEGCTATDTMHIEVFKGSAIYVPTAFTPNHDGLNDWLKPVYTGIAQVEYFVIYNRWGQKIFTTNNAGKGWDGNLNGQPAPQATYVWQLKAKDIAGKIYEMKGSFTLIR